MNLLFRIFTSLFICTCGPIAFANEATSAASADEAFTAAVQLFYHYSQKVDDSTPKVKANEIGGCCFLRGTKLTLVNAQNEVSERQTVSEGSFSFRGLKPGTYSMTASHRRLKSDEKLTALVPGKYLTVKHGPTDTE